MVCVLWFFTVIVVYVPTLWYFYTFVREKYNCNNAWKIWNTKYRKPFQRIFRTFTVLKGLSSSNVISTLLSSNVIQFTFIIADLILYLLFVRRSYRYSLSLIYPCLVFIGLPPGAVARFPSSRSLSPSCLPLRFSSSYRKLFYLAKTSSDPPSEV